MESKEYTQLNKNLELYVARIVYSTSTDGVGLRNSLYLSGCNIRCKGCHNKAYWDIESGIKQTIVDVYKKLNYDDFNISILGGEPLLQYKSVLELCKMIKRHTYKTIWLYSGYTLDVIKVKFPDILNYIDVLVDGPFMQEYYEPNLRFRGSTNQNIIDVVQLRNLSK